MKLRLKMFFKVLDLNVFKVSVLVLISSVSKSIHSLKLAFTSNSIFASTFEK